MNPHKLYGIPASLYTGKVRSYLIKQNIPYDEYGANHPDYQQRIAPVVGRFIIPVVETPDGSILQDGTDIIDYFEGGASAAFSVYPASPLLKVVSLLFELFGGEGLLRPAMHYRWNFDEQNLAFLRDEFVTGLAPPGATEEEGDAVFAMASARMRKAASGFGVTPESVPLIEASYGEFLTLLAEHLKTHPYLLGSRPTIGDFGLIAALYAHLGRDPAAALLMRRTAPAVSRYVERMHAPGENRVGYGDEVMNMHGLAVPDSLKALMRYVADEYLPEISAQVAFANEWLRVRPQLAAGTNGLDNPATRFIGEVDFGWRGISIKTRVMPYRFYLLQRVQDSVAAASSEEQAAIEALLGETGLDPLLKLRTDRRVERCNYLEVWGKHRAL